MSTSTHQIQVKGVDKTAGAFQSIKNRAAAAGADIRKLVGGAIAAAGAYLSVRAVGSAVNELGHLSDVAQKTSTNVSDLTRATTALNILGLSADTDQLAKAFQLMEKNTGRSGMQGFYDTIGELGKIPDAGERAAAAMKVFGRSGLEFMPLINAADESTDALQGVIAAMPGVSDAAAKAGDEASDAMRIAGQNFKSIWLNGIGTVVGWFSENYEGGIRQAASEAANTLAYYAKMAAAKCIGWGQRIVEYWRGVQAYWESVGDRIGAFFGGMSWAEAGEYAEQNYQAAMDGFAERMNEIDEIEARRTERFRQEFEDRAAVIEKFYKHYDDAARSTANREARDLGTLSASRAPAIRNTLILGESNAALRTALIGPQLQNEQKKTNSLLEKIAKNTEKTANNTEGGDDLAVANFT